MSSQSHRISIAVSSNGARAVQGASNEAGALDQQIDQNYPAATSGTLFTIGFTVAALQSIILVSDQNMTIKTNSNSSPANTINLIAGTPFIWQRSAGYFSNPFTTDVTAFYVTCTPSARLQGKVLTN
jgi:hypothetical protein